MLGSGREAALHCARGAGASAGSARTCAGIASARVPSSPARGTGGGPGIWAWAGVAARHASTAPASATLDRCMAAMLGVGVLARGGQQRLARGELDPRAPV